MDALCLERPPGAKLERLILNTYSVVVKSMNLSTEWQATELLLSYLRYKMEIHWEEEEIQLLLGARPGA